MVHALLLTLWNKQTQRHTLKQEHPHSKEGTNCSNCSNNHLLKRTSSLLERNDARPDQLTSFRPFFHTTSACHFKFSHQIPLLHCHNPSTVRGESFPRASWQQLTSWQASCTSWHNMSRAMWQLKATLASSQSSREKSCHLTGLAPQHSEQGSRTLCSHCSQEEVPSLSVHDSTSLSQSGLFWATVSPRVCPKSGN